MNTKKEDLLLACAWPASEDAWQRQCEIAQQAMTHYLMQRCREGHSAHAQVYGGVIALAAYAKALFSDEGRAAGTEYMINAIKAMMLDDQEAMKRARHEREALADGARPRVEALWLNPAATAALNTARGVLPLEVAYA